ncbi:MAG: flagellar biosynthetic protein FliR [Oscillospiraceae bacterium]|nr:flagellar biosynthetic protein FliR [Oscillospiraceae bacterium]
MLSLTINNINIFALVFTRIGGMVFFNPILNRRNVPTQFRIALVLGMSLLVIPTLPAVSEAGFEGFSFVFALIKELLVGFCFGTVFQIYYYLVFVAGDVIDMGFGISMARVFDPSTNIQTSLSGGFFQILFVVYFFITDCHLIFVRLIVSTFDFIELGAASIGADVGSFIFTQFVSAFALIMHLALPFMAASFVLEIGMGVLMKLIPQINVFSIHFQFKILLGLGLLFLFAMPVTEFVQSYINELFVQMQNLIGVLK